MCWAFIEYLTEYSNIRVWSISCSLHSFQPVDYASCIWAPYLAGAINKVECIQHSFTKLIGGLKHLPYTERLKRSSRSLESWRLCSDLLYLYSILFRQVDVEWNDMFKFMPVSATCGHPFKLFVECSLVDFRRQFFCYRVVNAWITYPPNWNVLTCIEILNWFYILSKLGLKKYFWFR